MSAVARPDPSDHRLDPPLGFLLAALDSERGPRPASLEERRRVANETMLLVPHPPQPGVVVSDHPVAVAGGAITVRVYRPESSAQPAPAFFFVHGGGWFQGNLETAEVECGPVASAVPAVVASVEYRLAPEHPFPIPLNDCIAAYEWFHANADTFGVDVERIAVGGTSAGGNLAAALCIAARDRGLPSPCLQLLEVPCLDLTLSTPSIAAAANSFGLTADDVREYVAFYLGGADGREPLASPMHAPDLSGLPPAVVLTAELDPLRDDGEEYLARLRDAGVAGVGLRVLGHLHGTWIIPLTVTSRLVADLRVDSLRRAFAGTLLPGGFG